MREPGLAPPDAATRVAEAARAAEPLLDMKQRTTRDDPDGFMDTFFRASRLHYIGTWKHRYEAFLEDLPAPPPLPETKRDSSARVVMHVDMDCFFAAVATLGRPSLSGLPVAVSWSSGAKGAGELSSCNYEARAFGVRAGGRVADALRRCPNLVVMPYEFEKYSAVALEVYRILHELTPHVMGVSVDEAYIDVTALVTGGGRSSRDETSRDETSRDSPTGTPDETKRTPKELAEFVRERVFNETGCVASVGIGPNRLIARLATMRAKPNGVFEVSLNEAEAYVASLPVRNLPGVGRGALEKLSAVVSPAGDVENEKNEKDGKEANARIACRDVLRVPSERLQRALGRKSALSLLNACRGIDQRDWVSRPPRKSVGAQVTWGVRFDKASEVVAFAAKLAGEVSARAVRLKVKGRCLTVKVLRAVANVPDGMMKGSVGHGVCDHLTRSVTLSSYADGAETLARFIAAELAAPRAAPAGGLGAGLGDGGRASATLDGIIAAIVGDPRAPPWASLEGSKSVSSEKLEETRAKDASAATRRVASRADETSARRVALAESLTGSVRVIMNVRDRAVAEAFARATYPRLAAHAETEGSKGGERRSGVAAACFSLCAVAFAAAATDATARTLRASLDDDARKTRGGEQNAVSSRENDTSEFLRRFHKLAVMKYAKDLARAASAALRDGAAAPEARVAAAGLATAMLAADDDALEAIARCGALDDLRLALEVAARAEDVPPLAKNARGLLKAMGA